MTKELSTYVIFSERWNGEMFKFQRIGLENLCLYQDLWKLEDRGLVRLFDLRFRHS